MKERRCPKRDCRNPPRPEAPTRGPWANLCQQHYDERRELVSANLSASLRATQLREDGADGPAAEGFEAKAKVLVSYGRQLDRRIADVKKARRRQLDAITLAREVMEQWKKACHRLAAAADTTSR